MAKQYPAPPKMTIDPKKTYTATIETSAGTITAELYPKEAPNHVNSFVFLAREGYYDGVIFHRVIPGFMIQGGDPTGTGTGGPGFTTVDTPPASAAYTHGVVAMAKAETQPNGAAGSQFFVVTEANAELPPDYAIIGTVTKGLSVVDHIGTLGNAQTQLPTMVIEIEKATVSTSG